MTLPTLLLAAASHRDGRIVLVTGAGCSVEPPTSLPMAAECSREAHRRLRADGVLQSDCPSPSDLSLLADFVFAQENSQRTLVERLPIRDLQLARPNPGHSLAAALLSEGTLGSILTLNFDLAFTNALTKLGGEGINVVRGPEHSDTIGIRNLVYLHRDANADPEDWILRREALDTAWQGAWEEAIATKILTSPIVVFVGMGSSAGVLIAAVEKLRGALKGEIFQVDPQPLEAPNEFRDALKLPAESYLSMGWVEFVRLLAARQAIELRAQLEAACTQATGRDGWPELAVEPVLDVLFKHELHELGAIKARWALKHDRYIPDEAAFRPLAADLLLCVARVAHTIAAEVLFTTDGIVEFWGEGRLKLVARLVTGEGWRRWASLDSDVRAYESYAGTTPRAPSIIFAGGVVGLPPAALSTPGNIVGEPPGADIRGFPTRQEVQLDADVVIVSGKNGTGKTSLFDAILWAITGTLSRLGEDHDPVSLYSRTGEVSVSLITTRDGRDRIRIFRRLSSGDQVLRVECDGDSFSGPLGEAKVIELFWPDAQFSSAPRESLARAFTQAVYLQQDLVRAFIESHDARTRRGVVSELIGVGRVAELQRRLEQERASWSRATTELTKSRDALQARLSRTQSALDSLSAASEASEDVDADWRAWWNRTASASVPAPEVGPEHPRAAATIERALNELRSLRDRQLERSVMAGLALQSAAKMSDIESLEARLETLTGHVTKAEADRALAARELDDAQTALSNERRELAGLADRDEQTAAFAKLGLSQLGERCPVCGQEYDRNEAIRRLTGLVEEAGVPPREADNSAVLSGSEKLEAAEHVLRTREAERRELQTRVQSAQIDRARWLRTLEELGVSVEPASDLEARLSALALDTPGTEVEALITAGQAIGLRLARQFEASQRTELTRQRANLENDLTPIVEDLERREAAYAQATAAIEILRDHSAELLMSQLSEIEPTLQRIYSRIDPHPSFREAKLVLEPHRTRGGISAAVVDVLEGVSSAEPAKILSSSQLNVLAASIFLALNLSMEAIPLQLAMLDDPLQSLDDLNLLGLVDVLRRVREVRQLLISTHDSAFADLLSRKLRPSRGDRPTVVLEVSAWGRQGPVIHQRIVEPDSKALFLVAG